MVLKREWKQRGKEMIADRSTRKKKGRVGLKRDTILPSPRKSAYRDKGTVATTSPFRWGRKYANVGFKKKGGKKKFLQEEKSRSSTTSATTTRSTPAKKVDIEKGGNQEE